MTKPWPTPEPFWKPRDDSPHPAGKEPSTDGATCLHPTTGRQPMPDVDGDRATPSGPMPPKG